MSSYPKRVVWFFLVLSLMAFMPGSSWAAADTSSVASTVMYEGPDRDQRLLAAARKEGSVLFYTSLTATDLAEITSGFEKKYGIKVNTWRATVGDILQRILAEATAGRFDFDAVHISTPEMEALHHEKILQAVKSPYFKDLIPAALPGHREWAPTCFNLYVQAYNTTKVKKEELPKTYWDLLDRRWKGRLGIEIKSHEWFYALVKDMGEEKGLKFFRDLVAINNPSQRKGNNVLNNLVVAGEVQFAINGYHFTTAKSKKKGAPVDWFTLEPTFALSYGVGISKRSAHPAAAMLLYDYMITDGQKLLVKTQRVGANKRYDSTFKNIKMKVLDPTVILNENEKSTKLFEDVLSGR